MVITIGELLTFFASGSNSEPIHGKGIIKGVPLVFTMSFESYLTAQMDNEKSPDHSAAKNALDDVIHSKSKILSKKLEILSAEIWWRLDITSKNLNQLADDKTQLQEMITKLDRSANYHLREHREKGVLYRKIFDIEEEKRSQQVECWRDVVMVMRDFLEIWENHEQSESRAIFLHNVGTGTQNDL